MENNKKRLKPNPSHGRNSVKQGEGVVYKNYRDLNEDDDYQDRLLPKDGRSSTKNVQKDELNRIKEK